MDYGHGLSEIEGFVSGFFKNEMVGNSTVPCGSRIAVRIGDVS